MNDESTKTPTEDLQLEGNPEDWMTNLNMRDWVQEALEAKGAEIIGAGCGASASDLDIEFQGMEYNIKIRPI